MCTQAQFARRDFLACVGSLLATDVAFGQGAAKSEGFSEPPPFRGEPDVEIELIAQRDLVRILDGAPTPVWRYLGNLLKGPPDTLTPIRDSYLGPTLRFRKGQKVRIHLRNDLPEKTITHWHGLHVPMSADGHPSQAISSGQIYTYDFAIRNRASLNFYHPHTHEATATQVYRGLAGLIIVEDDEERALALPTGAFEILLVIQDRAFNRDHQLVYGAGMHRGMFGFYGDQILVNGQINYRVDVARSVYRLRILNASNARIYKLAWDDGAPLTVIGVDGGLLNKPETRPYLMLAPAERIDLWVDFSARAMGSRITMHSLGFSGLVPEMAYGMMQDDGVGISESFPLFTITVTQGVSDHRQAPTTLASISPLRLEDVANPTQPRPIALGMSHMRLTLNERVYASDDLLPSERVPLGSLQLIDIYHDHGAAMRGGMGMMGMMSMAHPIHLHGQPFQILEREFDGDASVYASFNEGFVDSGLKDTVLVVPGERIRIIKPFEDYKGRFMYHCHNLEHEDMGMMREFFVE